jgi:hypothetical protein
VIKGIVIGFILAIAISVGCVFIYFSAGMAPVATADPPMPFEKKFANMALDAHIEKQHIPPSSVPADEPNFLAGAGVYKQHCVTDSQGSHPSTMRQRCFRNRHNCSVVRV